MKSDNKAGILHGFAAIGEYLGIGEEAARHRTRTEGIPVVHSGRRVWIRASALDYWLAQREEAARQAEARGAPDVD